MKKLLILTGATVLGLAAVGAVYLLKESDKCKCGCDCDENCDCDETCECNETCNCNETHDNETCDEVEDKHADNACECEKHDEPTTRKVRRKKKAK